MRFKMLVVPESEINGTEAAVMDATEAAVPEGVTETYYMVGEGSNSYTCGTCGRVLIKGLHTGQVQGDIFFRCFDCKAMNRVKPGT